MNILLLRKYNNYFNRILKKEDSLSEYKNKSVSYLEFTGINFYNNDGITTELVVGGPNQLEDESLLAFDKVGSPDYLVVYDTDIISRWFVIEAVKTRVGQYKLSLKRDLLADNKDAVLNAPCFVEKGTITDVDNPLLLNNESVKINQIKQTETAIKDSTGLAWLVGYVKKDLTSSDLNTVNPINYTPLNPSGRVHSEDDLYFSGCIKYVSANGIVENPDVKPYAYATDRLSEWWSTFRFTALKQRRVQTDESWPIGVSTYHDGLLAYVQLDATNDNRFPKFSSARLTADRNGSNVPLTEKDILTYLTAFAKKSQDNAAFALLNASFTSDIEQQYNVHLGTEQIEGSWGELRYQGDTVIHNGKAYSLVLTRTSNMKRYTVPADNTYLQQYLESTLQATNVAGVQVDGKDITGTCTISGTTLTSTNMYINFYFEVLTATAVEIPIENSISFNFPTASQRATTSDALYDIFAIPVNPAVFGLNESDDIIIKDNSNSVSISAISEQELQFTTYMMTKLGVNTTGALAYDLQLLPYCPLNLEAENGEIDISDLTADTDYSWIKNQQNNNVGIIFWVPKSNCSKDISIEKQLTQTYDETLEFNDYVNWTFYSDSDLHYCRIPMNLPAGTKISGITDAVWFAGFQRRILDIWYNYLEDGNLVLWTPSISEYGVSTDTRVVSQFKLNYYYDGKVSAVELKIANDTDFCRLTSPNFNSMFEFKLSKFKDCKISNINVDCTYKPYSPYIKLNPDFSYLYGKDFNDSTGLILQGDFSLPILADQWVNYELNNRNYQAIFNRQIENLDVNNKISMEQQQFGAALGAITGAVGGAATGAKAGPYGAIAGAAVGAGLGTVGGIIDTEWLRRSQAEQRSYAVDKFNLDLGTIKALPQSITKSTPLSYNNKVWPILEEFSCTEKEKEILKDKIKYDGMTVMAIGTLSDYSATDGYLKGRLIRLADITDDAHVANEIFSEVYKGFYVS